MILTKPEAAHTLDLYRHHWHTHEWPRAELVDVCAGHDDEPVTSLLNRWVVDNPGAHPSPEWMAAQLDAIEKPDTIADHIANARAALRRTA